MGTLESLMRELRDLALSYPETHEDFPWGESAFKVRGKGFLFTHATSERISLSFKLGASHGHALSQPYASPTHYGLGKHGWVTCAFERGAEIPVELLHAWIDESFRAVAPKTIVGTLAAPLTEAPAKKQAALGPTRAKKVAKKGSAAEKKPARPKKVPKKR